MTTSSPGAGIASAGTGDITRTWLEAQRAESRQGLFTGCDDRAGMIAWRPF